MDEVTALCRTRHVRRAIQQMQTRVETCIRLQGQQVEGRASGPHSLYYYVILVITVYFDMLSCYCILVEAWRLFIYKISFSLDFACVIFEFVFQCKLQIHTCKNNNTIEQCYTTRTDKVSPPSFSHWNAL